MKYAVKDIFNHKIVDDVVFFRHQSDSNHRQSSCKVEQAISRGYTCKRKEKSYMDEMNSIFSGASIKFNT